MNKKNRLWVKHNIVLVRSTCTYTCTINCWPNHPLPATRNCAKANQKGQIVCQGGTFRRPGSPQSEGDDSPGVWVTPNLSSSTTSTTKKVTFRWATAASYIELSCGFEGGFKVFTFIACKSLEHFPCYILFWDLFCEVATLKKLQRRLLECVWCFWFYGDWKKIELLLLGVIHFCVRAGHFIYNHCLLKRKTHCFVGAYIWTLLNEGHVLNDLKRSVPSIWH